MKDNDWNDFGNKRNTAVEAPVLYTKRPPGKVSAVLYTSVGFVLTGISLAGVIGFGIAFAITHLGLIPLCIFAILCIVGLLFGFTGIKKLSFIIRFHKYVHHLRGHTCIPIRTLAEKTGKSISFTEKDLQRMIKKHLFYEGHLDSEGGYLFLSHQAYQEYLDAKQASCSRQQEADSREKELKQKLLEVRP